MIFFTSGSTGLPKGVQITYENFISCLNHQIKNLDYIEDIASKAGAVNTVYIKNDKIVGTNTDGIGLVNSIKIDAQFKLKKKNILIIGSGGAARGIVYQLVDEKISSITLKNRNDVKAQELCKEVIQKTNFENIEIEFWKERKLKSKFDLVINTTSVGMKKDEKLLFDFRRGAIARNRGELRGDAA